MYNYSVLRKKLSNQIVTSPAKFRKQIADVGLAMQQEQSELRVAERKLKELGSWLSNIEETQIEVDAALEALLDVKSDVDKSKVLALELETRKAGAQLKKDTLQASVQQVSGLVRQVGRSEEKLAHLRKQAVRRSTEAASAVEEMQQQVVVAEGHRLQVQSRVDKAEAEAARLEAELAVELAAQEEERAEMAATYQRLERIVILHLQSLRRAVEDAHPRTAVCA